MEEITKNFQISASREVQSLSDLQSIAFTPPCSLEDCGERIKLKLTPVLNYFSELHTHRVFHGNSIYVYIAWVLCPPNAVTMAGTVVGEVMSMQYVIIFLPFRQ